MASASLVRRGMGGQGNGVRAGADGRRRPVLPHHDLEARQLLPPPKRKRRHHLVRVQGQLVLVQSASAADLSAAAWRTGRTGPAPDAVRARPGNSNKKPGSPRRRQQSVTDWDDDNDGPGGAGSSEDAGSEGAGNPFSDGHDWDQTCDAGTAKYAQETAAHDRQRRGYGIGGAGNIRRPTEVVHFASSSPSSDAGVGVATPGLARTQQQQQAPPPRRWPWTRLRTSLRTGLLGVRNKEVPSHGAFRK